MYCTVNSSSQMPHDIDPIKGSKKLRTIYNGQCFPPKTGPQVIQNEKAGLFQYRYMVVLMEFVACFGINCYRQNTSVSIVAMVNNSLINVDIFNNSSNFSCTYQEQENKTDTDSQTVGEFDWSPSTQGYVLGASFLGWLITQMPGGMLAETYGAKSTITISLLISSVCHFISPFASRTHSYLMIFTQLVRGMGQGLFPAAHFVVSSNWFPRNERGPLNTVVMAGFSLGATIGGMTSGIICSSTVIGGWPFCFYIYGGLGILFTMFFHFYFYETPSDHPKITDEERKYISQNQEMDLSRKRPPTPWLKIFKSVPVYALMIALFGLNWIMFCFVSVYPTFLSTILHFNLRENGYISSGPFLIQTLLALIASWTSNWIYRSNYLSVDKLRKGFHGLYCLVSFLCILGIYMAGCNRAISSVFAMIAIASLGIGFAGSLIAAADMSPTHGATIMGFASTFSSTAGFILPVVAGVLTNNEQSIGQWNKLFFLTMGIVAFTGIVFVTLGSAEIQPWNFSSDEEYQQYKLNTDNVKESKTNNNTDVVTHM